MGTRFRILVVVSVALSVGAAIWFAARAWGDAALSSKPPSNDSIEANAGRARLISEPNGRARSMNAPSEKSKSRRNVEERREPETAKTEGKPAQEERAERQKKEDDPFPRYLDMFKNNPEALAAEFQKEVEADRARQTKMREDAIAKLKLNAEQAALFVKALDDLKDEVTRQNEEDVVLITSGQLNEDTAADGSIWSSNSLLMEKRIAVRNTVIRETAEKLYEQLALDGISDAEVQRVLDNVTRWTAFSYECLEPNLAVYDKVYKNMGLGNGIFSWCRREHPQVKK